MRDNTHDRSAVIDRVEPGDAPHAARPRIDVENPGPAETAWRAVIDRADLPPWHPGPAGIVLVVSPHPDDETLAVGGLLHDLVAAGWRVRLASVTDGEAAYPGVSGLGAVRRRELASALDRLGIGDATVVHRLELPDGHVAQCKVALEARLTPLVAGMSSGPGPVARRRPSGSRGVRPGRRRGGRAQRRWTTRFPGIRFFPVWAWQWAAPESPEARTMLVSAERRDLSPRALHAKRAALGAFTSQQDGALGPPILPSHVLDRFTRPFEVLLR